MCRKTPKVSIGLPVYNGEKYVREAIESVLAQTFKDFELIISDNASTDKTGEICREYANKNRRIRYYCNEKNLGCAKNFNRTFELSIGEYFKWLADDDAIEPEFLFRSIELMEREPMLVLVCSYCLNHIENENIYQIFDYDYNLKSPIPHQRLSQYLFRMKISKIPIWGLMRSDILRTTHLIRPFIGTDDCLLIELALKGKFGQIPLPLLRLRDHDGAYHSIKHRNDWREGAVEACWIDTKNTGKIFLPYWRRLREYTVLVLRSDERFFGKLRMLASILHLSFRWFRWLGSELIFGIGLGPLYHRTKKAIASVLRKCRVIT